MDIQFIITTGITVLGWGVTLGICKNKIEQHSKDIEALKVEHEKDIEKMEAVHNEDVKDINKRQNNTDQLLQSINSQLVELNTKMSLLIKGKINVE